MRQRQSLLVACLLMLASIAAARDCIEWSSGISAAHPIFGQPPIKDMLVHDGWLVTADILVTVRDIADPAAPVVVGSTAAGWPATRLRVVDGQLYACCFRSGLMRVDLSLLGAPSLDPVFIPDAYVEDVVAVGDLIAVNDGSELVLLDDGVETGRVELEDGLSSITSLAEVDGYVYAATFTSLTIVDVSDPVTPVAVGVFSGELPFPSYESVHYRELLLVDDLLYATVEVVVDYDDLGFPLHSTNLLVLDVTDPLAPVVAAGREAVPASRLSLSQGHVVAPATTLQLIPADGSVDPVVELSGGAGFATACWHGAQLYGARTTTLVHWEVNGFEQTTPVADISYAEDMSFAFGAGRFRVDQRFEAGDDWDPSHLTLGIVSVDDPLAPLNEGTIHVVDLGWFGAALQGADADRLAIFVGTGAGVLELADMSGAFASGLLIGYGNLAAFAGDVLWTYAYSGHELTAFDVSDMSTPILRGSLPLPVAIPDQGTASALADQRLAIVAQGRLLVVDISDPAAPVLLADVDPGLGLQRPMRREGDVLFAARQDGLVMLTGISAGAPVVAGDLSLSFTPAGLCPAEDHLVAYGESGFQVLAADPVGGLAAVSPFEARPLVGVACHEAQLYVDSGDGAQVLYEISTPETPVLVATAQGEPHGGSPAFVGGYYLSGSSVFLPHCVDVLATDDLSARSTALAPVHPNPFNPRTVISYELARAGRATVTVHDLRGRLVTTLVDAPLAAGKHRATWFGTDRAGRAVASGLYLVRLRTAGSTQTTKATLVR